MAGLARGGFRRDVAPMTAESVLELDRKYAPGPATGRASEATGCGEILRQAPKFVNPASRSRTVQPCSSSATPSGGAF